MLKKIMQRNKNFNANYSHIYILSEVYYSEKKNNKLKIKKNYKEKAQKQFTYRHETGDVLFENPVHC